MQTEVSYQPNSLLRLRQIKQFLLLLIWNMSHSVETKKEQQVFEKFLDKFDFKIYEIDSTISLQAKYEYFPDKKLCRLSSSAG
jgi:hypothetical protein